ncbi:MAG TPA: alpha-hydroxy-acid oxidizing protein [Candidatus Acidoferrales bacterium]|nr:alpha-hydroxy-acid oxidizing protein [Candidatus Acidoferrales bacterium]
MAEPPAAPQPGSAPRASGRERMMEIFKGGLAGAKPAVPVIVEELERLAREKLPPQACDYVAGGAGSGATMLANLRGFERWRIVPRMLRDVAQRDWGLELFGQRLPAPLLLAPVGVQGILHPDAELATARAAAAAGVPFVLSTAASRTIEQVAEAIGGGPRWFQLYWGRDNNLAASMVSRAERAGYGAIVLTLDTPTLGWRERDLAHPYIPFLEGDGLANYFSDPVFRAALAQPPEQNPRAAIEYWASIFTNLRLGWNDIAFLRRHTRLPLLVKGIVHPDDASSAVAAGADAVIVSNHGGRQVDGAIGALDALPGVVQAVAGAVPVLFDSGVRRGADAAKALALGAKAVLLGRPYVWGLAAAGEQGVREMVANFLGDLDLTLALSGFASLAELNPSCLVRDAG